MRCEIRSSSPKEQADAFDALGQRGEWRGKNIHVTRTGRELHVESSVAVSYADNGSLKGMVAVIRDITERKHAEETLYQN